MYYYTKGINKVNPTWTDKIKNQIVLSYSCLPIPSLPLLIYIYIYINVILLEIRFELTA